ncbi:Leucine-rich repeats and WD repeat domain-containing protein 1, variant 2 [Chamberlinius hualienensis]
MLSMCKDEHGKIVLNVSDCDKLSQVKVVQMKNLGLLEFDQHMFSQMSNVEELDISGNCLENIPEVIKLPKIKKLNCARNKFSDVMFVQQFPTLQEVDFSDNDITFPDFCIASVLCPTLKKINDQEIDFKDLDLKMESRLKPLINQVWAKHFASSYSHSTSDAGFELMSEKFRIMLKHANIQTTKLVTKFKDFKLLQLIDQFLEDVRTRPGQGRSLSKHYQRNTKINSVENKLTNANATCKQQSVPIVVIVNKEDGTQEAVEATLLVLNQPEPPQPQLPQKDNEIKKPDLIFEDEVEETAEETTEKVKKSNETPSGGENEPKKIKYWVYDESKQQVKKMKQPIKPKPKRKPKGWLEKFIINKTLLLPPPTTLKPRLPLVPIPI